MAIKYNTSTGSSLLNQKAKQKVNSFLKPTLSGMKCKICTVDSVISFEQHQGYEGSSSVDWVLTPCCTIFEKEVYAKLGVNR